MGDKPIELHEYEFTSNGNRMTAMLSERDAQRYPDARKVDGDGATAVQRARDAARVRPADLAKSKDKADKSSDEAAKSNGLVGKPSDVATKARRADNKAD